MIAGEPQLAISGERYLIVNADDFGQSPGFNRGVIEGYERGIVTSASLMVRWPATQEAASYGRTSQMSVGLHVDLGEWAYRQGAWRPVYEVVDLSDRAAVELEVEQQVETFRTLMDREPTHLDSHQHVHRSEPVASVMAAMSENTRAPLRHRSASITYEGSFYGQTSKGDPYQRAITVGALVEILGRLKAGWTELGCHPGRADDFPTVYLHERATELRSLCAEEVLVAIARHGVHLRSFHDAPRP